MDILGFLNSHSEPSRLSFVSLSVQSWKTVFLVGLPLWQIQVTVILLSSLSNLPRSDVMLFLLLYYMVP